LRLRNIGGIIVVDFIDMVETAHKKDVVEALRKEMVFDRTKSRVLDMTDLGLVEITRKKVGSELGQILLSACPTCHGDSHTPSGDYIARKIKCKLKRLFADGDFAGALVTVHTSLFEHMFTSGFFSEACETVWADKRIYMVPSDSIRPDQFTISGVRTAMMHLPPLAKLLY
jgi:ribonuclease G